MADDDRLSEEDQAAFTKIDRLSPDAASAYREAIERRNGGDAGRATDCMRDVVLFLVDVLSDAHENRVKLSETTADALRSVRASLVMIGDERDRLLKDRARSRALADERGNIAVMLARERDEARAQVDYLNGVIEVKEKALVDAREAYDEGERETRAQLARLTKVAEAARAHIRERIAFHEGEVERHRFDAAEFTHRHFGMDGSVGLFFACVDLGFSDHLHLPFIRTIVFIIESLVG